ncbi:MAG: metalloregulator ArsR/SmtB family transcription factor [Acidobacteriota bacterium]
MQPADLSTIFAALADPTRRAIMARLVAGDAPVKDLAEPFELSGPAITKHLKVLERAGLISRSRQGQQRPCRLEPRALAPAADWIEQYREMWEERLARLDAYLKSIAPQPTRRVPETKNNRTARPKRTRTRRGNRHGHQK